MITKTDFEQDINLLYRIAILSSESKSEWLKSREKALKQAEQYIKEQNQQMANKLNCLATEKPKFQMRTAQVRRAAIENAKDMLEGAVNQMHITNSAKELNTLTLSAYHHLYTLYELTK